MSPSLGGQAVNDPTSVECFPAENSDASTSDTVAPVNCNKGNNVVAENQGGELPEVRKKLISSCSLKNLNVFMELRYIGNELSFVLFVHVSYIRMIQR